MRTMAHDDFPCIYCPTTNRLIDIPRPGEDIEAAIQRLTPEYGTALVAMPYMQAATRVEDALCTEPSEISEQRFLEMLNILPPLHWTRTSNGESFKIRERIQGDITSIFVHLNKRFFTFDDRVTLSHTDCCAKVFHSPAYRGQGPTLPTPAETTQER